MARVYVGGLDEKISERELEGEFVRFGTLKSVWVGGFPGLFAGSVEQPDVSTRIRCDPGPIATDCYTKHL